MVSFLSLGFKADSNSSVMEEAGFTCRTVQCDAGQGFFFNHYEKQSANRLLARFFLFS